MLKKLQKKYITQDLKKLSLLLLSLAIIISLSMTVLSSFFIHLIYGQAFMGASIILQIYVWSSVGTFLGVLASNYLITENNQKTLIFMTFIPMIINVILNILWIPKYGIVGSAYATLISYSFGPLTLLLFKKTRGDIKKNIHGKKLPAIYSR